MSVEPVVARRAGSRVKPRLTLSCGDYEITRPLIDGRVTAEGIELEVLTDKPRRIYSRALADECDVAEFNVAEYVRAHAHGHAITALPVFLHRRFRHGYVYVNTRRGVRTAADLAGQRVGIFGESSPAAGVWIRGILQDIHGVDLDAVEWLENPLQSMEPGAAPVSVARPISEEMLLDGEIDALVSPGIPAALEAGDPRVARLFPDYKERDVAYFRATGIFPIMHCVTIRAELVERDPWIVESLLAAFAEAKDLAFERIANPRVTPLAFLEAAWEEQRSLLGPDPWEYGLTAANRHALQTLVRYAREQGRITTEPSVDELFVSA